MEPNDYRVYYGDLDLVVENWRKRIDDPTLNPCADIDQRDSGAPTYFRVFTSDLAIVITNWEKTDPELEGDCPRDD